MCGPQTLLSTSKMCRLSSVSFFFSTFICLELTLFSTAWMPTVTHFASFPGLRGFRTDSKSYQALCRIKPIQMVGAPPPPRPAHDSKNVLRKPPPPPPPRSSVDSKAAEKVSEGKNAQEGTFSNPIDGMVYQDEKGYPLNSPSFHEQMMF